MVRHRDGFRDHSTDNTQRLFGDVGSKLSDQVENRFYLTIDHVNRELPGGLTKQQLNDNPEQANPDAVAEDFNKKWNLIRLADKLTFRDDQSELNAGLFWFHRNEEERGFFSPVFRQGITTFYSDNYGFSLNYVRRDEWFGRRNVFNLGLSPQLEDEVGQNFENLAGHRGRITALNTAISINAPFYLEDQYYLTNQFSVLAGMQLIYAQRRFEDHFPNDAEGDQSHRQNFSGWNPKTGLIYEFDHENQLFVNFSGSWQPPSFDNLVEFEEGVNSSVVYSPLEPQRAHTIELGTRGQQGRFEWELSLYHSWLRNELLELNDAQGNSIGAVNVNRSCHQGIEAGVDVELLKSVFSKSKQEGGGNSLTLSQSYTLNDFHFDDDPVYGHNRIAGVPTHFYEAELLYENSAGFYAGPSLRCNLTRYPVDQANTLFADSYTLIGFKIGYRARKGLSLFLEAQNLTDKHFPSAIDPIADARTAPDAQIFHPGDGRSFYGGVSYTW
jgi:iron complex outermembrane receptor protein